MILNKENLTKIQSSEKLSVPSESSFSLPEKVLQFGTGVLLRGLPDYYIDKANRQGIFNGRIAVVKSTGNGSVDGFGTQDSLYTIGVRGIERGVKVDDNIVCSSISRVISAQSSWDEVLKIASSEDLQVVISNTTEVGIELVHDDVNASPPISFPGKLLAVLYKRYQAFDGDEDRGLIILPTELISDNGAKLKDIVISLASQNNLEEAFTQWLEQNNRFCNTLVDRIVPGKPDAAVLDHNQKELGYQDDLFILAEAYNLWAIEGDDYVKDILTFEKTADGVVITSDITLFKELKLRLLNGSHTLSCAVSFLSGMKTVYEALENENTAEFVSGLLSEELTLAIPYPVAPEKAQQFAKDVLDRFANPHIRHYWLDISTNYTLKMKMRVIPILLRYFENFATVPSYIAFGFAAYLIFMRTKFNNGKYYGENNGSDYVVDDGRAAYFSTLWLLGSIEDVVTKSFSNVEIWDADLNQLPGFADSVIAHIRHIDKNSVADAMKKLNNKRIEFDEK